MTWESIFHLQQQGCFPPKAIGLLPVNKPCCSGSGSHAVHVVKLGQEFLAHKTLGFHRQVSPFLQLIFPFHAQAHFASVGAVLPFQHLPFQQTARFQLIQQRVELALVQPPHQPYALQANQFFMDFVPMAGFLVHEVQQDEFKREGRCSSEGTYSINEYYNIEYSNNNYIFRV